MRNVLNRILVTSALSFALCACNQPLEFTPLASPAFDESMVAQLQSTRPTNLAEILEQNQLNDPIRTDFVSGNPYTPLTFLNLDDCQDDRHCHYSITETGIPVQAFPARASVQQWWQTRATDANTAAVCGVRFLEDANDHASEPYELRSFNNLSELEATPGYVLTHFQQCGTCSTLQDLAVYGSLDLTVMAKTCSKRPSLNNKKSCMMEIGFTEACAESWAYNADKTAQSCLPLCVKEYGLIPLLTGTESSPNANNGELNQCLQCDEMISGPGFQYSAGRTRRNSGVISEIDRPGDEVYTVTHEY